MQLKQEYKEYVSLVGGPAYQVEATDQLQRAKVGKEGSPDRRLHWINFEPVYLLVDGAIDPLNKLPPPCLTVEMARSVFVNGLYMEERSRSEASLRLPDEILGDQGNHLEKPITGLSWYEAESIVRLCGGRMPSEKEIDLLASEILDCLNSCKIWGQNFWSPFSYSLCVYDKVDQLWSEPSLISRDLKSRIKEELGNVRTVCKINSDNIERTKQDIDQNPPPDNMDTILTWIIYDVPHVQKTD
jgi:hypothetical protein